MKFFKNLKNKIENNVFWKSVISLSFGQIIAFLINLGSTPVLSRLYGKESFGDLAILISTATIIMGIIGLGLGSAIMVPKDNEESEDILVHCFLLQLFLCTIICVILAIIAPFFQIFTVNMNYYLAIGFLFLYILLSVLSTLLMVYLNKLHLDKILVINSLIGAGVTLVLKIPFGFLKMETLGQFISTILALIIINGQMLIKVNPFKNKVSFKKMINIIKKYKSFVLFQYPSNLIGTLTGQITTQTISSQYGNEALGDYDMTNRVIGSPLSLVSSPIQTVYFRTVSQRINDGEEIADFTYDLVKKIMLIGFLPLVVLLAFGAPIFSFVLGEQWHSAGKMASYLSIQFVFSFVYSCITYGRVAIGKQKVNFFFSIFNLVIIGGAVFWAHFVYGTVTAIIIAFAVANAIYNFFNIALTFFVFKKNCLKFIVFGLAYTAIAVGIAFLLMLATNNL